MGNEKYTIADVARQAGVSPATVSRVLNNRPGVGEELRQKVLDFIKEIDYKPNTLARSFTKGSINIVALIFGDVRNPFYADLVFHIQKSLNEAGYMVMAFNSEYDAEKEIEFIELARQFNFAGLILFTVQSDTKRILQDVEMPVVLVNRTLAGFSGDVVLMDNFQGGYMATKHLIELGHRNAAFIFGHMNSSAVAQRYQGYLQLLKNFQIEPKEDYILYGDLKMETGFQLALDYAKKIDSMPTSVVVSNDLMAIGFINGLRECGIQVPEQVSVVGFDNIDFGKLSGINLTTIDQKCRQMSEHAVRLILQRMETPDLPVQRVIIEPELIVRGSTATNSL